MKRKTIAYHDHANKIKAVEEMSVNEYLANLQINNIDKVKTTSYPTEAGSLELIIEEMVEVRYRRFLHIKKLARSEGSLHQPSTMTEYEVQRAMISDITNEAEEEGQAMPPKTQ